MARINLLPWRAERRAARQKEFLTMIGMAALAGVVVSFLIVFYYNSQIKGQEVRNTFLRGQITEVDKQIAEIDELDKKKAKLLARKEVIEQLQANRSQMVHLFDSLVRTIPDGVILTTIKQEGDKLTLSGRSQSNARVSTYMRTLEGSGWMTKPDLSIIEAQAGDPGLPFTFTLSVTLANPNAPQDTDGDGVPDAPAATIAAADTGAVMPAATETVAPAVAEPATPEQAVQPESTPPPAPASEESAPAESPAPAEPDQGGNAS